MTRLAAFACLAVALGISGGANHPLARAQAPAQADTDRIASLVQKLGSNSFADREAAEKELAAIGEPALNAVRAACRSANPEQARRAQFLSTKIGRKAESRKLLTPTLVEIDATDTRLDAVLVALSDSISKQADPTGVRKYHVTLGGPGANTLARKPITLKTGRVPFWEAVLALCDVAGLQIQAIGGFVAPGSTSQLAAVPQPTLSGMSRRNSPNRVGPSQSTLVLEARVGKKRPAVVAGAVCIEAFPVPSTPTAPNSVVPNIAPPAIPLQGGGFIQPVAPVLRPPPQPEPETPGASPAVVLQVWPEPTLVWQSARDVAVSTARDTRDQRLVATVPPPPPTAQTMVFNRGGGMVVVQNMGGRAVFIESTGTVATGSEFVPNARQAVVRLRPGEKPTAALEEFAGSLFGVVRSGIEPAAVAAGLVEGTPAIGISRVGVDLRASLRKGVTRYELEVELAYEPGSVQPAGLGDRLPAADGPGPGNYTFNGVRVTDADGKPYFASGSAQYRRLDPTGRRTVLSMKISLTPTRSGQKPPSAVTFWATSGKPVEVPFTLRDVPVIAAK